MENGESVEDKDTWRSHAEGSSRVLVGSSACLCDEGHPQLPEPRLLKQFCEKQKDLPPRVQGIRGEVTLHVLWVQGQWHLCPSNESGCSVDICGDPAYDREALGV